ncbi:MAG: phosphoglycerate dehydrogenase [Leptospira sp.]|nr:phosphoglycerate dehydrogenase [Leptospira sp.]
MLTIFVSTFPFGKANSIPRDLLSERSDIKVLYNPENRKLTKDEILKYAIDADVVIAGTEDLSLLIDKSLKLKMIARVGIGLDSVNLLVCREKGIRVSYTPDAVTMAVAELTIGLMIGITRLVGLADREIRKGLWNRHYGKRIGESLIGLIGFGRVGKNVAKLLLPFSPKILVNDINEISEDVNILRNEGLNISETSKDEIFSSADIVSLHLPAYKLTNHMLNQNTLSKFKPESYLINTARGELIDERALFDCLKSGAIAGAALDVFNEEPYIGSLTELDNVILTQHMGSCSYDCRLAMETQATEDVLRFLSNEPLLREVPEFEYKYQL